MQQLQQLQETAVNILVNISRDKILRELQYVQYLLPTVQAIFLQLRNSRQQPGGQFVGQWSDEALLATILQLTDAYSSRLLSVAASLSPVKVAEGAARVLSACALLKVYPACLTDALKQLHAQHGVVDHMTLLQGTVQLEVLVDRLMVVDVVAETVDGRKLAIEADGPHHFRFPDGQLTGATLQRNRMLKARGYIVVSVPYSRWSECRGSSEQQQLLQQLVDAAMQES
ncbi:hypothetical protein OEZ86_014318 [Tetradesmus obliquus]|nr:hypothetical protein OEZ86_014318 [Tetradesmus obliquus]